MTETPTTFMSPEQIESALFSLDIIKRRTSITDVLYESYVEQIEFLLRIQRAIAYDRLRVDIEWGDK
jgi:hypothetical protein